MEKLSLLYPSLRRLVAVFALLLFAITGCSRQYGNESVVILISIDGFRHDYMDQYYTPNLQKLADTGVKAESLTPVFPTLTFPNHYSMVTGQYPQEHGIVGNTMMDPVLADTFSTSDMLDVTDGRWYEGEPIWVTLKNRGLKTATYFWPGSNAEIAGQRPTYWHQYDQAVSPQTRVEQVLAWIDLSIEERPNFIALSFQMVDTSGHADPHGIGLATAVQYADTLLGQLFTGLVERQVMEQINIIVVSDHGMTDIDSSRIIFIDDYIEDLESAGILTWSPILALRPDLDNIDAMYNVLKGAHPHMQIYRREELPERYHYSNHFRIPPIIGIADEGWSITNRDYFEQNMSKFLGGAHGYDPQLPSMQGIFIARGPAFLSNESIPAFENVHVYNIVMKALGLMATPSDDSEEFMPGLFSK